MKTTCGEDKAFGEEESDDEEVWEGWEVESESSDDSSDSGAWTDVESDGEDHLSISDGDGEDGKTGERLPDHRCQPDLNARNDKGVLRPPFSKRTT